MFVIHPPLISFPKGIPAHLSHYSDEVKEMLARLQAPVRANPLLKYSRFHAACVVTHVFVEDEEALDGAGLLHVFLDHRGNVLRQWRVEEGGGDDCFDGCWAEGSVLIMKVE
jgi:hypothetical protein